MADKNKKAILKNKILSIIAYLIINFVCATSKIIRINKKVVDELKNKFGRFIIHNKNISIISFFILIILFLLLNGCYFFELER
ncbi:MAG: hypothetical protein ACK4JE_05945, partial [Endomicrobiia bacterium]